MDERMIDWLPGSFEHKPSWRWARATWLQDQQQPASLPLDDAWVRRALAFLTRHNVGQTKSAFRRTGHDPAIADALSLSREIPPDRRCELEARLLADQPIEVIAQKCSLPVKVVEAYEALWFNIRPFLHAKDWIAAKVIGPGLWVGFTREEEGQLWKFIGWNGGAMALDVLFAVTRNQPLPDCVQAVFTDNPAYEESRLRLMVKLTVAGLRARSGKELQALTALYEEAAALDRDSVGTTQCLEGGLKIARSLLGLACPPKKKPLREPVLVGLEKKNTIPAIRTKQRRSRSQVRR